ncbi:hypothetical protein [Prochlorococcus sp. MIT 1303]|uniref:hypothetical protein n=1 Tax=Prochlorococcus sp. MIT 1303 TaxID=1723647 RepID=UPI0007B38286|nr:hypothetical protein [Prochlorococcus sp. MIT 1303]KZR65749.1 hypothetical protein PMIT1303_01198 [Prochlorococcus sp. MIT 1303]
MVRKDMPFIKLNRSDWHHSLAEFQQRSNWVWLAKSLREVICFEKIMRAKTYSKINKNSTLIKVSKITAALDMNQYVIAGSVGQYNYQEE